MPCQCVSMCVNVCQCVSMCVNVSHCISAYSHCISAYSRCMSPYLRASQRISASQRIFPASPTFNTPREPQPSFWLSPLRGPTLCPARPTINPGSGSSCPGKFLLRSAEQLACFPTKSEFLGQATEHVSSRANGPMPLRVALRVKNYEGFATFRDPLTSRRYAMIT
ncbi:hypothetical protein BZL39_L02510 [Zygosaccharomyces parabailii]|nr:hypothetical protein BZL39_L02510 [Zygosaccharomyces parabailii]